MASHSPRKVQQSTLRQTVWRQLREAILKGEIPPGTAINQAHLAEQFGVSRGPLREALSLLEEEGLVRNIPYRGTFVADFDDHVIEDTYSLRRVLEQFAVERAIVYGSPDQLAELQAVFEEMVEVSKAQDTEQFYELDLAFHRHLYSMAKHEMLLQMWAAIEANVRRGIFYGNIIYQFYSPKELLDSHRRILEAVVAGDVQTAKREVDDHITDGSRRLIAQWRAAYSEPDDSKKGRGNG